MTDGSEPKARTSRKSAAERARERLAKSEFQSPEDVQAARNMVSLSQPRFARALGISVHTLRNWEQGRRTPDGPAVSLLRIAVLHPDIFLASLASTTGKRRS